MSADRKKEIVRQYYEEILNKDNLSLADELVTSDYASHDPSNPTTARGRELLRENSRLYRSAFPDLHFRIEDILSEGDEVVVRWTASGTHKGEFAGLAPTGRYAEVSGIQIIRFRGEKIAEDWSNWDTLGLLRKLGAIPAIEERRESKAA